MTINPKHIECVYVTKIDCECNQTFLYFYFLGPQETPPAQETPKTPPYHKGDDDGDDKTPPARKTAEDFGRRLNVGLCTNKIVYFFLSHF